MAIAPRSSALAGRFFTTEPGLHARDTDWLSVCLPYAGRRG